MFRRSASTLIKLVPRFPSADRKSGLSAQPTPTADDGKRAIEQKLQKIWKNIGTAGECTALFQAVAPGRPSAGSYPFRVSLTMHDYEAGYPKNRYYGQSCVVNIEEERYILTLDEFGAWQAEGRMAANMSAKPVSRTQPLASLASRSKAAVTELINR
jgi:hypothetical protein